MKLALLFFFLFSYRSSFAQENLYSKELQPFLESDYFLKKGQLRMKKRGQGHLKFFRDKTKDLMAQEWKGQRADYLEQLKSLRGEKDLLVLADKYSQ